MSGPRGPAGPEAAPAIRPPRVLVLSRTYPNSVMEILGLWVERLVRHSTRYCQPKVIAPVPYVPWYPGMGEYHRRFRRIERHRADEVEVFHPRFLAGPGYSLHSVEWLAYYLGVRRCVHRLYRTFPFELIHAHFTYPDGVVAAHLARRYRVPVVITEQVPWRPWMDQYPLVRRQAVWAAGRSAVHIAISRAVRDSIVHFTGDARKVQVVPDGVDGSVFALPADARRRVPDQILFVGVIRPVKGLDVLLRTMRRLVDGGRAVRLVVLGESYYRSYRNEEERLKRLAHELGLDGRVQFKGKQPLAEIVRHMQESALLVLPSRAESLGMVLVEALACGTPVVATRCGGPEDIVTDRVGVLVPVEDPDALAQAIVRVLERGADYPPAALRAYALDHFGLDAVGGRMAALYAEALRSSTGGDARGRAG